MKGRVEKSIEHGQSIATLPVREGDEECIELENYHENDDEDFASSGDEDGQQCGGMDQNQLMSQIMDKRKASGMVPGNLLTPNSKSASKGITSQ